MGNFDDKYSYEALLDNLRATYSMRKKKFEEKKHLMSNEDRILEQSLFTLESDALSRSEQFENGEALFNFDQFMSEIGGMEQYDSTDSLRRIGSDHNSGASERKHVCPKPGCNKSYTSSHGLKYHLNHGHIKEKENIHKPFICTVEDCGKAYRNSNGLKYHMSKVHNIDK